jgi:hypothetical protein
MDDSPRSEPEPGGIFQAWLLTPTPPGGDQMRRDLSSAEIQVRVVGCRRRSARRGLLGGAVRRRRAGAAQSHVRCRGWKQEPRSAFAERAVW